MAKPAIYYEEAKRLYVIEGLSLEIIVERLGRKVARRTLQNWKSDGSWDKQRENYVRSTEDLQHELYDLAKLAISRAKADPSPQNMFAMAKAVGALKSYQGVKVIEEEMSPKDRKLLTGKTLEEIEKEHHIL